MTRNRAEEIDVGKTTKTGRIFIAFPPSMYDRVKLPLSGGIKHVACFQSREDVEWLIKALRKELRR